MAKLSEEQKEFDRLIELLDRSAVPAQKKESLIPVVENLAWQRVKLNETREIMKKSQVVISYDNGGGQKGIRENPIYKGYLSLWRGYMNGFEVFLNALPSEIAEEEKADVLTILDEVKAKRKKAKQ